jgi:hypothetical protein
MSFLTRMVIAVPLCVHIVVLDPAPRAGSFFHLRLRPECTKK